MKCAFVIIPMLSAAILGGTFICASANAQQNCGDRKEIVDWLQSKHKEWKTADGLSQSGGLVELFESQSGATWTLILSFPGGLTCALAAGTVWESWPPSEVQPETQEH